MRISLDFVTVITRYSLPLTTGCVDTHWRRQYARDDVQIHVGGFLNIQ